MLACIQKMARQPKCPVSSPPARGAMPVAMPMTRGDESERHGGALGLDRLSRTIARV